MNARQGDTIAPQRTHGGGRYTHRMGRDEAPMSLEQIAAELGCTPQRVSSIIAVALAKLRRKLAAKGVKSLTDIAPERDESHELDRI